MVPPMIHRVFTACGIKDASAMIVGSRNRPDVLKATIQVLHGGVSRDVMDHIRILLTVTRREILLASAQVFLGRKDPEKTRVGE